MIGASVAPLGRTFYCHVSIASPSSLNSDSYLGFPPPVCRPHLAVLPIGIDPVVIVLEYTDGSVSLVRERWISEQLSDEFDRVSVPHFCEPDLRAPIGVNLISFKFKYMAAPLRAIRE